MISIASTCCMGLPLRASIGSSISRLDNHDLQNALRRASLSMVFSVKRSLSA